jgi:hypothetical protein
MGRAQEKGTAMCFTDGRDLIYVLFVDRGHSLVFIGSPAYIAFVALEEENVSSRCR